jgi:hypothetical protein
MSRSLVRARDKSCLAAGLSITPGSPSTRPLLRNIADHPLLAATVVPADASAVHVPQIRTRQEEYEKA